MQSSLISVCITRMWLLMVLNTVYACVCAEREVSVKKGRRGERGEGEEEQREQGLFEDVSE